MSDPLVLVTGASGYLASHVTRVLLEEGYRVRGTVRSLKNEEKIKHLRNLCPGAKYELELVEADLMSDDGWEKAVEGCTYVHHVASPFPMSNPDHEDEVIKPAVEGTKRVLKACAGSKTVKRVVLTSSSVAIFASGGNKQPYTEKDWADPNFPHMPFYSKSKIFAEKAAWDFVKDLPEDEKFELAVTNPVLIAGPTLHGSPGTSCAIITRLMERQIPMIPKFFFSIIDVRDCAKAHLICMTLPEAAGNRHILSGSGLWMKDMALILDKEFRPQGYNVPTTDLPGVMMSVACVFDKDLRTAKNFAKDEPLVDNSRMTKVLGITHIDVEKTLIDMGYSLIENGLVKKMPGYKGRPS